MKKTALPTLQEEKALWQLGYFFIAGIDEAGRGPLAGPVVAAAVVFSGDFKAKWKKQVNDSKQLSEATREDLFPRIQEAALCFGVGSIDAQIIDTSGIAKAGRLAMKKAVDQLNPAPDFLLVDYFDIPEINLPQKGIVHGDCISFSIACASILAKVTRDRMMVELDGTYPEYEFAEHKGYGTAKHLECLKRYGPSPIHRCSFQPVKDVMTLL